MARRKDSGGRPSLESKLQQVEKELHKCAHCGHDGGNTGPDRVVKQENVVGVGGYACVDLMACSRRIKKRAAEYCTVPLSRSNVYF